MNSKRDVSAEDEVLRADLFEAYDSLSPSPEAIDRMFSRIQEECASDSKGSASATVIPFEAAKKRSRFKKRLAGSIAACLAVLAGIGAFVFMHSAESSGSVVTDPVEFSVLNDIAADKSFSSSSSLSASESLSTVLPSQSDEALAAEGSAAQEGETDSSSLSAGEAERVPASAVSVVLDTGKQLALVPSETGSLTSAQSDLVAHEVSAGTLYTDEAPNGVSCIVFDYSGDDADYAVKIEGLPEYFLANPEPEDPDDTNVEGLEPSGETDANSDGEITDEVMDKSDQPVDPQTEVNGLSTSTKDGGSGLTVQVASTGASANESQSAEVDAYETTAER